MRIFLSIFILIFVLQSPTKADDITEFEIEGMSIGDSLLNHMNINEIKKAEENKNNYPGSNYIVIFYNMKSKIYDDVEIVYDSKDESYIIQALTGIVEDANDYRNCKIKKKEIVDEFKLIFKNSEIYEKEAEHVFSKGSMNDLTDFYLNSGGFARVSCTDWSKKAEQENLWVDNLKIALGSDEFGLYLSEQ